MLLRDQSVYQRENSILAQLKDTLVAYEEQERVRKSAKSKRVRAEIEKAKKDSIIDREIQIMYGSVQEVMDILENDGEEGQDLHKTRQFLWDYAKWSGEHTKARGIITGASKGVIQQWIDEDHREHLRKY